jgi:hypothetical protein
MEAIRAEVSRRGLRVLDRTGPSGEQQTQAVRERRTARVSTQGDQLQGEELPSSSNTTAASQMASWRP